MAGELGRSMKEEKDKKKVEKIVAILKGMSLKEAYQMLDQAQTYLTENVKIP